MPAALSARVGTAACMQMCRANLNVYSLFSLFPNNLASFHVSFSRFVFRMKFSIRLVLVFELGLGLGSVLGLGSMGR